ncbi:hypothetical protein F5I97DRAFT_1930721 [Phlebopus sp. FC_14]|nr:hypothetical protein F5I97DRAFT_1930721 [Phlebopus sp. FC_14]
MSNDALEEGEITEGDASSSPQTPPRTHAKAQLNLSVTTPLMRHDRWSTCSAVESNCTSTPQTSCSLAPEPMTAEELDRAKSLVLDLLGWGVTPEYLVHVGVSAGALHRIFTDLRLRFPANLIIPTTTLLPALAS